MKFEALQITGMNSLEKKLPLLQSSHGFGEKCQNALETFLAAQNAPPAEGTAIEISAASPAGDLFKEFCTFCVPANDFVLSIPGLLEKKFDSLGISSPEDLIQKLSCFQHLNGFGETGRKHLFTFMKACIALHRNESNMISFTEFLKQFRTCQLRYASISSNHQRQVTINLLNSGGMTLHKIAEHMGVTRERVRQINCDFMLKMRNFLLGLSPDESLSIPDPEMIASSFRIVSAIRKSACLSFSQLLKICFTGNPDALSSSDLLQLKFAISILGGRISQISLQHESEEYCCSEAVSSDDFKELMSNIFFLLQRRIRLMPICDVIFEIHELFDPPIDDCAIAGILENSLFTEIDGELTALKFRFLHNFSDMAERILCQAGEPLHFTEIFRRINELLAQKSHRHINTQTSGMLRSNISLVPIGSTGKWALREWNQETRNLKERLTECFQKNGGPLSFDEICDDPLLGGDYAEASIYAYLNTDIDSSFLRIEDGRFILADWRNDYQTALKYNRKRWHEELKSILNGGKSLTTEEITRAFLQKNPRNLPSIEVICARLQRSPCLMREKINGRVHWKWAREYNCSGNRRNSVTQRTKIIQLIQEYFLSQNREKISLKEVRNLVCKKLEIPTASFYQAVDLSSIFIKTTDENGKILLQTA